MRYDGFNSNAQALRIREERPLFQAHGLDDALSEESDTTTEAGLSSEQLMRLYLSHFLSTWNSRCYEFAAVRV